MPVGALIRIALTTFPDREDKATRTREVRLALFDRLGSEPGLADALIRRYRPGYLLIPAASAAPDRGGPWSLIQSTDSLALWARAAGGGPAPTDANGR